jgi:ribose 5-phosphate isomerase B
MIQNLAIASDHAGYKLKNYIVNNLKREINLNDFGTNSEESCDFPDFAKEACDFVVNNEYSRGLLICGSGVGMSIAANKIKGIRASNVVDKETAMQSVEHNDVNVLCLGANNINEENVLDIVVSFLDATLIQEERYLRRISKLED